VKPSVWLLRVAIKGDGVFSGASRYVASFAIERD